MKYEGLLKSKTNNYIYAYLGNDEYKNLTTGVVKKIELAEAQKLFVIPINLNLFAEQNDSLINLIESLKMETE